MAKFKGKKQYIFLLLGGTFSVILILGLLANTLLFSNDMNKVTEKYIIKNNRQMAESVSYRLESNSKFISEIASSLSNDIENNLTLDYLEEKANSVGIDELFIIDVDLGRNSKEVNNWINENSEIWNSTVISSFNDSFIFSSPIYKDEKVVGVIAGIEKFHDFHPIFNQKDDYSYGAVILYDYKKDKVIYEDIGDESNFDKNDIDAILSYYSEDDLEKLKSNYLYASSLIDGTSWVQISVENNHIFKLFIARYVHKYLFLIFLAASFFIVLFNIENKDIKKRKDRYIIDKITGGYNREGFLEKGNQIINNSNYIEYSVVCLDICEFRKINDSWGEHTGNEILRFIYNVFRRNLKENELVCRTSMDHYSILMHESEKEIINQRVMNMIKNVNDIIHKKFIGYDINFTIGVCQLSVEHDLSLAIGNGIYVEKNLKKHNVCIFYNREIADKRNEEYEIDNLFYESIRNRDFKVYLQPKVAQNGNFKAEALVRWIHPIKGIIYPNQFISFFEKNGKIFDLDLYVFEEVCKLLNDWKKDGKELVEVSVNLSRFTLRESGADIWKIYKQIKDRYDIPNDLIEIELTETTLIENNQIAFIKEALDGFHSCGLKVSLDDFGFAYSSLFVLKEFDVDTIKLDKSFFVDENVKSKKIVANIIQLAHSLNISVVAEGIEEISQVDALWSWGCDFIQGYVYSKPMPINTFEVWRLEYGR